MEHPDQASRSVARPSRGARAAVVAALVGFTVSGWIGDLLLSVLLPGHPAILLALSDRLRNIAVASPRMGPLAFFSITFVRVVAPYPFFFLLGRWYGDAGVRWMEERSHLAGMAARRAERWFSKARFPLVALCPVNLVCVFAGASDMGTGAFLLTKAAGSGLILVAARFTGSVFHAPFTDLTGWIGHHRAVVLGGSFVVVLVAVARRLRTGGRSQVGHLAHFDAEINAAGIEAMGDEQDDLAPGPASDGPV